MDKYSAADNYTDPTTGVLKNLLNINTQKNLDAVEADFVSTASNELSKNPLPGEFNLAHLQKLHKHLFGEIYDWAGCLRTIDISKGETRFANWLHIETAAKKLFDGLKKENHLHGLSKEDFIRRAAYYLGEINVLHPFRDGNGRVQREFISHLAYENFHFIDWSRTDQETMIAACIAAYKGDYTALETLIGNCIEAL